MRVQVTLDSEGEIEVEEHSCDVCLRASEVMFYEDQ